MNLISILEIEKYAPFKRSFMYWLFKKGKIKKHTKKIVRTQVCFDLDELQVFLKDYNPTGNKRKNEQSTSSNN